MSEPIELDVYVSPYCSRCDAVLERLAMPGTVQGQSLVIRRCDVVANLDAAVAVGVRSTPAFVLNGRLLASGAPSRKRLLQLLRDALAGDAK